MDTKMNEAVEKKCYDIIAGPNRDALFDACKYAFSKSVKFSIGFSIAMGYTMPKDDPRCAYIALDITDVKICSIEHEDGSGDSFNLSGFCMADLESSGKINKSFKPYKFDAYYNAKKREGHIAFS